MSGRRPRVSVGIPVYNGARYLAVTLDAFLAQTFGDFEIIVCDNASTDGTEAIARAYAAKDRRITYVRHPANIGAAANYGSAFGHATGEYFKWAASDDLPGATLLERSVEVLDRHPEVVMTYPRTQVIDEHGTPLGPFEEELDLRHPSAAARGIQVLERVGRCNPVYGLMRPEVLRRTRLLGPFIGSDKALLFELSLHGQFREIPEELFFRRMHPGAFSCQSDPAALTAFYTPQQPRRTIVFRWKHLRANASAAWRSPAPRREKARLLAYVARTALWQRQVLARELVTAARGMAKGWSVAPSLAAAANLGGADVIALARGLAQIPIF